MSQQRVQYSVTTMPSGRYRAQVFVDEHPCEKRVFDTRAEAERWANARVAELQTVVR